MSKYLLFGAGVLVAFVFMATLSVILCGCNSPVKQVACWQGTTILYKGSYVKKIVHPDGSCEVEFEGHDGWKNRCSRCTDTEFE